MSESERAKAVGNLAGTKQIAFPVMSGFFDPIIFPAVRTQSWRRVEGFSKVTLQAFDPPAPKAS